MTETAATNKTIDRTIQLLEHFGGTGAAMNVAEISRFLDVSRITAQAIVNSLEKENYIEKNPDTGDYSFGYKMFVIGNRYIYRYPFLQVAQKHVARLSQEKNLKINVSVLKPDGQLVILLSRDVSMIPYMVVGSLVPGHLSASGKAFLAFLPEERRNAIIDRMAFRPATPHSITDKEFFKKELLRYRELGYATEVEELSLSRACIAAPILDITGTPIAAVSISDYAERMEREFDAMAQDITLLGRMVSAELGFQSAFF